MQVLLHLFIYSFLSSFILFIARAYIALWGGRVIDGFLNCHQCHQSLFSIFFLFPLYIHTVTPAVTSVTTYCPPANMYRMVTYILMNIIVSVQLLFIILNLKW